MKFNERLKQKRNESNLTQDQLAEQLHITRQAVSNWERGITEPNLDMLQKLSDCLSWPVNDMMNQVHPKNKMKTKKILVYLVLCIIALIFYIIIEPGLDKYRYLKEGTKVLLIHLYMIFPAFFLLAGAFFSSLFEHMIQPLPKKAIFLILPVPLYYICLSLWFFAYRPPFYIKLLFGLLEHDSIIYTMMFIEGMFINLLFRKKMPQL